MNSTRVRSGAVEEAARVDRLPFNEFVRPSPFPCARQRWQRDGYVVLRGLLDADRVLALRTLCERVRERWRRACPETGRAGGVNAVSIHHLNHPGYFGRHPAQRVDLLALAADPALRALCHDLLGEEPLFRCISLFMNPEQSDVPGDWHRDGVFASPDTALERVAILAQAERPSQVRIQIALVPTADLEYVPGSHQRVDTLDESQVRRLEPFWGAIDGSVRIGLGAGDALVFNACGLHRGHYRVDTPRRTLMLSYTSRAGAQPDYFSRQPWFQSPGYLDDLDPEARAFYQRFIAHHAGEWEGV